MLKTPKKPLFSYLALFCISLLYFSLTLPHLNRPGVYDDEVRFPSIAHAFSANKIKGPDQLQELLSPFPPYTGGVEDIKYFLLFKYFKVSLVLIRRVAILTGFLSLMMFFCFANEFGGLWVGFIAALLLASDPNFFVNIRQDYSSVGNSIFLTSALACAALLWWRTEKLWALALAALLSGIAFWNHALSLLPAGSIALATLILEPSKTRKMLLKRTSLILVIAGFCVGASPWLWYAFRDGFPLIHLALDSTFKNLPSTRWNIHLLIHHCRIFYDALNGERVEDFILDSIVLHRLDYGAIVAAVGSSYLIIEKLYFKQKDLRPLWTLLVVFLCSVELIALPNFYAPHHVVLVLFPWLQLMIGFFVVDFAHKLPKNRKLLIGGGMTAILLFLNLRATLWIRENIMKDRVIYEFSRQVKDDFLNFFRAHPAPIIPVDCGFNSELELFLPKSRVEDSGFPYILQNNHPSAAAPQAQIQETLKTPDAFYVLHPEDKDMLCSQATQINFFRELKANEFHSTLVRVVNWDIAKRPIFEIYTIKKRK